jgi:hypothetical protein
MNGNRMNEAWYPTLTDVQSATRAVNRAARWAFFMSAVTGALVLYVWFYQPGQPVLGIDESSFLDVALMLVLGWRIKAFSKPWGFVGVGYAILNLVVKMMTMPVGAGIMGSLITLMIFVNGVRGMYAYDKFATKLTSRDSGEAIPGVGTVGKKLG